MDNTALATSKVSRSSLRILLVDDDETDCELLSATLVEAGFAHPITRLRNGGIAVEYSKYSRATGSLPPHIILLDLNMPVLGGIRALMRLREASSFHEVPVIILSGDDDPAKRREAAHLGIFRFLRKEANSANVIAALDDFMGFYNHEADFSATPSDRAYSRQGSHLGRTGRTKVNERRDRDKVEYKLGSRPRVHLR